MEAIEREFEDFFSLCQKQGFNAQQLKTICQPLVRWQRVRRIKHMAVAVIISLLLYAVWCYCDSFAWTMSALGRLMLMQVLPYWDWTQLYNAKCLIERTVDMPNSNVESSKFGGYETDPDNCALCDGLEHMPTMSNVTYAMLETNYLERGLPVIVTDANVQQNLTNLLDLMQEKAHTFLNSEPCDLNSNLLLRKFFNLETAIQRIRTMSPLERWFLQLRNCRFSAVKSSRLFMSRPYFYPPHLEPYYSSWLLMSHNIVRPQAAIYLRGLIFVQQLSGHFDIQLNPKQPCDNECPMINVRFNAGECLIFSSDLWRLSYGVRRLSEDSDTQTSIATVLEIDWQF